MAWNSKEGILVEIDKSEEYMGCIMGCLNTTFGKTTSYKYGLIKSILDNLFNSENYEIKFEDLCETFLILYWNLIIKYKLPHIRSTNYEIMSSIEKVVYKLIEKYKLDDMACYDFLSCKIKNEYKSLGRKIFEKYVVGALYSDFKGKIYGFDKKKKIIYFNSLSFNFLSKNKCLIEKLNYYSWILWTEELLEKQERNITNISVKLDLSTKRSSLNNFRKELINNGENSCFYCKRALEKNCHVDHFIPWSFVKNDKIWNLVLSCGKCNTKKNNKIPNENYLNKLIKRNEQILGNSYEKQLNKLYKSSIFNGFIKWNFTIDEHYGGEVLKKLGED